MRILVTGIYGFIGSYFAKWLLSMDSEVQIVGFGRDSDLQNRKRVPNNPRLKLVHGDLREVSGICEHIDVVINFAAKTFVDHSILDDGPFYESNVLGAKKLMRDAMDYKVKRFVQISTDEVYGQILIGAYKEDALLNPRNPYSWSKASADLYAIMLHRMYQFPVIITRTENNFGPYQHRQKALPTFIRAALANEPLPVYGDGLHVRCWLHVEEHCRAIWHLVRQSLYFQFVVKCKKCGKIAGQIPGSKYCGDESDKDNSHSYERTDMPFLGEIFHIAGEQELTNIALAKLILKTLGKPENQIRLVPDSDIRPGHDRRYALDCSKLKATGFTIRQDLETRLQEAINWYAKHQEWK